MQGDDFKKVSEMKPLNSQLSFATSSPAGILFRNVLALLMLMMLAESAPAQINCGAGTSSPSSNLACLVQVAQTPSGLDRKSTRLNSSHANISYAGFCLKTKN